MNTPSQTRSTLLGLLACGMIALPSSAFAESDSPWLPIPGEWAFTVNRTEQSGDSAYIGGTRMPISAITGGGSSKYKRSSNNLRIAYGLADSVSLDATLGYGNARVGNADNDSGQLDSVLGVNWRVLDEFERPGLPTLTLRGAAIIKGGYDGARLAALGNNANGYELAVIAGKQLSTTFSLWGEIGIQDRSGAVPTATFFELSGRYRFAPKWSASLGYSDKKYGGSLDIGGPGFTPSRFQEVRAERSTAKLAIGYGFASNQGVSLNLARLVSGRNTVKDDLIVGLSYTIAF